MSKRFTATRVPDSGIELLFGTQERWQAWLAIESALALTEADLDMIILGLLGCIMTALADLAERSAEMVMAGRTHGQNAVPITFGLKVASWIDEIGRSGPFSRHRV